MMVNHRALSLFNIYVHDFPLDQHALLTQFADDTTIHLTHNNPKWAQCILNRYLVNINNYLKDWKLMLSSGKTEMINIMGRVSDTSAKLRKNARGIKITLDGNIIPISNDIRLLGVQFQTNNLATKNIKIRIMKARRAKMSIIRLLRNQFMCPNIKNTIYKLYLRSILTYGAPIWCQPPHLVPIRWKFSDASKESALNIRIILRGNVVILNIEEFKISMI